jgi:hypothetical protein
MANSTEQEGEASVGTEVCHSLDRFCPMILSVDCLPTSVIDVGRGSASAADRWATGFSLFSVCNLRLPVFFPIAPK